MTKLLVFAINIIYVSFSGSSASHSFIVESKAKGMFHGSPAVIKFHIPTKAALQEAYYTPIQPLDVLADKPPEKKFECVRYPHMPAFICYTLVILNFDETYAQHLLRTGIFLKPSRSEGHSNRLLAEATGAQEREGGPRRSRHCQAAVSEHNPAVWKWTHEAIAWCCT
ncbi:hypothetical protein BHM03_00008782 [Ensete ventricosum]|nr:hypothetical protein BHM03_00008782 [Ensete ventricosum]